MKRKPSTLFKKMVVV